MKKSTITMKAFLKTFAVMAALLLVTLSSCTKEQKKYAGDAQVAFGLSSYSYTIDKNTTINLPVQLIASEFVAATGTVTTNTSSTATVAATYTGAYTIDAKTFAANIAIAIDYAKLPAGKSTLVLDLASNIAVAANYKSATITITKK